jgi:hypothetical protein
LRRSATVYLKESLQPLGTTFTVSIATSSSSSTKLFGRLN